VSSPLDGWYDAIEEARPWAEQVIERPEFFPPQEQTVAKVVLGVQGLVRELENRALVAERQVEFLTERLAIVPKVTHVSLPPQL
jgi:hypothetical protein